MKEPAAIVQSINEEQTRSWESVVDEIAQIDMQETEGALRMGDLLLLVEAEWGPKHLKTAAEQAGIGWSVAEQRHRVSKQIPKDSPIRKMRTLNFTHLRAIAATDNPEYWARRVEEEGLSTRALLELLEQAGIENAVEKREACAACGKALPEGPALAITINKAKRARTCNAICGIEYLKPIAAELQDAEDDLIIPDDPWAAIGIPSS